MDLRIGLQLAELNLADMEGNVKKFNIIKELGRGGSCIAYSATYMSNQELPISVCIKECYPFEFNITRNEKDELIVADEDKEKFRYYLSYIEEAFRNNTELYGTEMSNDVVIPDDIYYANGTVYMVTRPLQGNVLSLEENYSFSDYLKIVKSVARSVRRLHQKGFLYLDVKPSNLWIVKEHVDYVQFFDFDSIVPINTEMRDGQRLYRISYTKGFAPIEQQRGDIDKIGIYSDVYSVGALLFYLVFRRVPEVYDCEAGAEYIYDESIFKGKHYRDKIFGLLDEFFHNTLATYYRDRYSDMQEVETALEGLSMYAEEKRIYVHKSHIEKPMYCFGREEEIRRLREWGGNTKENCIIVSGLGGLGKSTLVRQYIDEVRKDFDNIIVLSFTDSIIHTICDDNQLVVNIVERNKEETESDYYVRKVRGLKSAFEDERTLFVIDNFEGEITRDFLMLLDEWKVIITTRENRADLRFPVLLLEEIKDNFEFYNLVEKIVGYELDEEGKNAVDIVIDRAYRNTLVVEMFAKQIKCSHFSFEQMVEIANEVRLTQIDKEKINVVYDDEVYHSTIGEFLRKLFSIEKMSDKKQSVLKLLSIYGIPRISYEDITLLVSEEIKYDDLNELSAEGWIFCFEGKIEMHPLIRECISNSEWSDAAMDCFVDSIKEIYMELHLEGDKANISRKFAKRHIDIKNNEKAYEIIIRFYKKMAKDNIFGELLLERIKRGQWEVPVDRAKLNKYLQFAERLLDYAGDYEQFREIGAYNNIAYAVVMNLPSDREEDIYNYSVDLLNSGKSINEYAFMNLMEKVIDILVAKKDYEVTLEYLDKAYKYAKKKRTNYAWGRYYDLLSWYYDARLEGCYDNSEEYNMLLESVDKSIKYMKRAHGVDVKRLYAKYLLSKVNIMMRNGNIDKEDIDKNLDIAKKTLQDNTLSIAKERYQYDMVCARYFVDVSPSYSNTVHFINTALDNSKEADISNMEFIDELLIPSANMSLDHAEYENAEKHILFAIKICNTYIDMLPYKRKRQELLYCLMDIYQAEGNQTKIEALNKLLNK